MTIDKIQEGSKVIFELTGRLDTTTAPQLEAEVAGIDTTVSELIFNFSKLEYLSSAGLRVILGAQKKMKKQGSLVIKQVNEIIMEVFEVTGFSDILTIE